MEIRILFRGLSLAAILTASSCALPNSGSSTNISEDGAFNHPISVEPSYQSAKFYYNPGDTDTPTPDQIRLESFVADYLDHGSGSIAVSAPSGRTAQVMISYFAQRINDLGVPKDHIIVATHDALPNGDMRVEINYVSYQAHTDKCGDWSENLAYSADNLTPKNFGCSVQQNIAAQIADPRDLLGPRAQDPADAARRAGVVSNYEQGQITQATKRSTTSGNEQAAPGAGTGY